MGVCRKIYQQKEGPNMLFVDCVVGWRDWVIKKSCGHGVTKRERKWKVNYWDLDEVTECWEENSLVEGCLRLLMCSWDEVMEAQLLCPLPGLEPFDHPVWLCVCTLALHTFTLVLNLQTRVWLNCDLGTFKTRLWDLLRNRQQFSVVRGRVWWSQGSMQTVSLQDKTGMCRLKRNTETHMEPVLWHRGFHQPQVELKDKTCTAWSGRG